MSTPKTFTKQSVTASPDEDVLQIKDTEGNIISWIDSNGIPAGNMAPGTSVVLETNGVHNGSQSLLNLSAGNNITLTDNGAGTVTIASQTIPANGLIAEYKFDQGLGSVLVDSSGNNNNGTLQGTILPTWLPNGGLEFNSLQQQCVSLPTNLNNFKTAIIATFVQNQGGFPIVIGGVGGTTNIALMFYGGNTSAVYPGMNPQTFVSSFLFHGYADMRGTHLSVWSPQTSGSDIYYVDGTLVGGSSGVSGHTGNQIGGNLFIGKNAGGSFITGSVYYAAFYDRILTALEIAQINSTIGTLLASRGTPIQANGLNGLIDVIATDGDSISNTQTPYTNYFTTLVGNSWTVQNVSLPSMFVRDLQVQAPLVVDQCLPTLVGRNCVVIWAGTNDVSNGISPNNAFQYLATYCKNRRDKGWKVVVVTMISRNGQDINKNSYNNLIRSNWRNFADVLCDVAAEPLLGADNASTNLTYFLGGIHPTTLSDQTLIGPMIQRSINRFYGNVDFSTSATATGTYNQVDTDTYLKADPSGGNVIINLQTSKGYTGQNIKIKNIQTAGVNTVTVNAASGETIDGAASITIANNTDVTLQSVLVSASSAGANWVSI